MNAHDTDQWDGVSRGSTTGNWIFMRLIDLFGPLPAYALLLFVALHYTVFDRKSRHAIRTFRQHLRLPTRWGHLYRHIFSFGMNLVDGFAFLAGRRKLFSFSCVGEDILVDALGKGKGLILLSAHVGNWEVAANLLPDNQELRINIVMMDNERESIRRVFKKATDRRQVNIIPANADPFELMHRVRQALARNEVVGFLGDRVREGVDSRGLEFLGEEARFPVGPFAIAAITGAPIVTVLTRKIGLRRFEHRAYKPVVFDPAARQKREERIKREMQRFVSILEQAVRDDPYQWFNFYDFWKQ